MFMQYIFQKMKQLVDLKKRIGNTFLQKSSSIHTGWRSPAIMAMAQGHPDGVEGQLAGYCVAVIINMVQDGVCDWQA